MEIQIWGPNWPLEGYLKSVSDMPNWDGAKQ